MPFSMEGAMAGASMGSAFGPWGMLGGAVLGGFLGGGGNKTQERLMKEQTAMIREQRARATDSWNFYIANYRPLEEKLTALAMKGYDPEDYAGRAAADVAQSFAKAREQSKRNMMRQGINPQSGASMAEERRMAADQARADAYAQVATRRDVDTTNRQMLQDVARMGMGIPGQSQAQLSNAASGMGGVAEAQGGINDNMYNSMADLGQSLAGMNWKNPTQQLKDKFGFGGGEAAFNGTGTIGGSMDLREMGSFNEGGKVHGPSPKDSKDNVPAMLTAGEYVLPVATVRKLGTEKLDKMVEKTAGWNPSGNEDRMGMQRRAR